MWTKAFINIYKHVYQLFLLAVCIRFRNRWIIIEPPLALSLFSFLFSLLSSLLFLSSPFSFPSLSCLSLSLPLPPSPRSDDMDGPVEDLGSRSCVTRFVKTLLSIMEHGVKPHSKHLTEYFAFLYEFAKMGEEEVQYCQHRRHEYRLLLALRMLI